MADMNDNVRARVTSYVIIGISMTLLLFLGHGSQWKGTTGLHTIMESLATMLALMVGVMALLRYYSKKQSIFLFVGAGFLGTGFLDAYHAIVTSVYFQSQMPSALPALIPWSWIASRQFLSMFMFLSWIVWLLEVRSGKTHILSEKFVYIGTFIFTILSFLFFAFSPLPPAYYPEMFFHRPEEFVPGFFFALALIGYLYKGGWRENVFEHWLVISLIIGLVSQIVIMSHSGSVFDYEFDLAHLLKKVSYLSVLTGLLVSMYAIFRSEMQTSASLKKSEETFRRFAEHAVDWLWEMGPDLRFTKVTGRVEEVTGMKPEDLIGKSREEIYGISLKMQTSQWKQQINELKTYEAYSDVEIPLRRLDGVLRVVSVSASPIYDDDGKFNGFLGVARDITDRKKAERELQKSERRLRTIIDAVPSSIFVKNAEGRFLEANKADAEAYGLNVEDLVGKLHTDIRPNSDDVIRMLEDDRKVIESGVPLFIPQEPSFDSSGEPIWLQTTKIPCAEDDFGEPALIGNAVDITKLKVAEEQIRRTQKLEAVGQLTGGVAHDFNNILGIVYGNLEILEELVTGNEAALNRIEKAYKGVNRGTEITRKLLSFSRKDVGKISKVSVNDSIISLEELVAKSLTASIKVETHLSENLWTIEIDPGDLEDAILNLSLNARDAMPEGGSLIIETANKTLDEKYAASETDAEAGDFVMISVSDTGVGMSSDIQEKVLEPFFTTKEQGKGTGLGLSMVYGFVQRSGGHLSIYSEVGHGTTIRAFLPRIHEDISSNEQDNRSAVELPRGTETILIVDDEEFLRDIARAHLQRLGYKTLSAENGSEALKVLNEEPAIDLVFSDIVMPGKVDGYQLAITARIEDPSIKVLLTSGFTKSPEDLTKSEDPYLTKTISSILGKPYNKSELALAIRKVLDADS